MRRRRRRATRDSLRARAMGPQQERNEKWTRSAWKTTFHFSFASSHFRASRLASGPDYHDETHKIITFARLGHSGESGRAREANKCAAARARYLSLGGGGGNSSNFFPPPLPGFYLAARPLARPNTTRAHTKAICFRACARPRQCHQMMMLK